MGFEEKQNSNSVCMQKIIEDETRKNVKIVYICGETEDFTVKVGTVHQGSGVESVFVFAGNGCGLWKDTLCIKFVGDVVLTDKNEKKSAKVDL